MNPDSPALKVFLNVHESGSVAQRHTNEEFLSLCVCVCAEKTETAVSAFERHESKLDYKQTTKGAKEETRKDPRRKREGDRGGKREAD